MEAPNGFFIHDLIYFADEKPRAKDGPARWAKGFKVRPADLRGAADVQIARYHEELNAVLAALSSRHELQINWNVDSNFAGPIEQYKKDTNEHASDGRLSRWGRITRSERESRFRWRMENENWRRMNCEVYIVTTIENPPSGASGIKMMAKQITAEMDSVLGALREVFEGGVVTAMKDVDHYESIWRFFNPALAQGIYEPELRKNIFEEGLVRDLSIQDNCWFSDFREGGGGHSSLSINGLYMNLIAMTRLPNQVFPTQIAKLTEELGINDYAITVVVWPKDPEKEIKREEGQIQELDGQVRSGGAAAATLVSTLEARKSKVMGLASGSTIPLDFVYLIKVWDADEEELSRKTRLVEQKLASLIGCKHHVTRERMAARGLLWHTFPGWTGGSYKYKNMYAQHDWLSCLLPIDGCFTGTNEAQALYDGANGNLVNVSLFEDGTPLHSLVLGASRSGKSVFVGDLLSQVECNFDLMVIVEEGLSHGGFTTALGYEPIVVTSDGSLSINYLDTGGLPLSSLQINAASALLLEMVGKTLDEEKNGTRRAQLSWYIRRVYDDHFQVWIEREETKAKELAVEATALAEFRKTLSSDENGTIETYTAWRELGDEERAALISTVRETTGDELTGYRDEGTLREMTKSLYFATISAEEFPTHAAVSEMMRYSPFGKHPSAEIQMMADKISVWKADGEHGPLFDGATNIDMDARVLHFELGKIGKSNEQLKAMAAFLISLYARQRVLSMPRSSKKVIVFEEVAQFLKVGGAEDIVSEFYAQLGKFSCAVVSITQQYGQLKKMSESGLAVIIGNSRSFFLLRQGDSVDLDDLGDRMAPPLPDAVRRRILRFPAPTSLPPDERHSRVFYYVAAGENPVAGEFLVYTNPALNYVTSSTGADFEKRRRELGNVKGDSYVEKVLEVSGMDQEF